MEEKKKINNIGIIVFIVTLLVVSLVSFFIGKYYVDLKESNNSAEKENKPIDNNTQENNNVVEDNSNDRYTEEERKAIEACGKIHDKVKFQSGITKIYCYNDKCSTEDKFESQSEYTFELVNKQIRVTDNITGESKTIKGLNDVVVFDVYASDNYYLEVYALRENGLLDLYSLDATSRSNRKIVFSDDFYKYDQELAFDLKDFAIIDGNDYPDCFENRDYQNIVLLIKSKSDRVSFGRYRSK